MTVKRVVLLALLGVAAGILVWLPGQFGGSSSTPSGAHNASTAAGSDHTARAEPGHHNAGHGGSASPSSIPAATPSGDPSQRSTKRGRSRPGHSSEILPQPSSAPSAASGLPGLEPVDPSPLVSAPLPKAAVKKRGLVVGYPSALAPPRGSTVETTSVSPAGSTLQVALTARCKRPCSPLLHFRVELGRRGFEDRPTSSVENLPAAALVHGQDSVSIAVVSRDRKSIEYAVLAILHAAKA